ncbi:hypothetical protein AB1Y20_006141 [Prymnesium parvum]|uniref:Centrosomal protein of 162 kDa n=1 Tax=Prymnesium parvum TaxID=97485 RepID=A0AB34J1F4_PRYPA
MRGSVRREYRTDIGSTITTSIPVHLHAKPRAEPRRHTAPRPAHANGLSAAPVRLTCTLQASSDPSRPSRVQSARHASAVAAVPRRPASAPLPLPARLPFPRAAPRKAAWTAAHEARGSSAASHAALLSSLRGGAPADLQVCSRRRQAHERHAMIEARRAPPRRAAASENAAPLAVRNAGMHEHPAVLKAMERAREREQSAHDAAPAARRRPPTARPAAAAAHLCRAAVAYEPAVVISTERSCAREALRREKEQLEGRLRQLHDARQHSLPPPLAACARAAPPPDGRPTWAALSAPANIAQHIASCGQPDEGEAAPRDALDGRAAHTAGLDGAISALDAVLGANKASPRRARAPRVASEVEAAVRQFKAGGGGSPRRARRRSPKARRCTAQAQQRVHTIDCGDVLDGLSVSSPPRSPARQPEGSQSPRSPAAVCSSTRRSDSRPTRPFKIGLSKCDVQATMNVSIGQRFTT